MIRIIVRSRIVIIVAFIAIWFIFSHTRHVSLKGNNHDLTQKNGADIERYVHSLLTTNKIVVFSKTFCPYCVKVKKIFESKSLPFKTIELGIYIYNTDLVNDSSRMKEYLRSKYGYRTITILTLDGVPTIFISGKKIKGGVKEVEKLNAAGLLDSLS